MEGQRDGGRKRGTRKEGREEDGGGKGGGRTEEGREEGEERKRVMKYIPAVQALIRKCSIDDECCTCQLRIQLSSTMVNFLTEPSVSHTTTSTLFEHGVT